MCSVIETEQSRRLEGVSLPLCVKTYFNQSNNAILQLPRQIETPVPLVSDYFEHDQNSKTGTSLATIMHFRIQSFCEKST